MKAFSHHATTVVWVGAYLEIVSMGLFLAFAVWLCARLGGGLLGSVGRGMVIANTAVSMVSLALLDTEAYLAGHELPVSTARVLVTLNGATFITTWFLTAFLLVANGISFGSVIGLYVHEGIGRLLLAFVAPHGVLELFAICVAGGGGFLLASAILL